MIIYVPEWASDALRQEILALTGKLKDLQKPRRKPPKVRKVHRLYPAIKEKRESGEKWKDIGNMFNLSPERVKTIFYRGQEKETL